MTNFSARARRSFAAEMRKLHDTRGRATLLAIALVLPGSIGCALLAADPDATAIDALTLAMAPAYVLLPIIVVICVSSEWSQRGGLLTFAAEPNRYLVGLGKLLVVLAAAIGVALVATLVVGLVAATIPSGLGSAERVDGLFGASGGLVTVAVTLILNALLAMAIGALIPITAVAVVVFLVFTAVVDGVMQLIGPAGKLLQFNAAVDAVSYGSVLNASVLLPLVVWVLVPLLAGSWAFARRDAR